MLYDWKIVPLSSFFSPPFISSIPNAQIRKSYWPSTDWAPAHESLLKANC